MRFFPDFFLALSPRDRDFAAVGQAILEPELLLEDMVDAFDDVIYHRFWRVIDAAQLSQLWIIGVQERFIEMYDRISAASALAEVAEDVVDVGVGQRLDDVVDETRERFVVELGPGDLLEEGAQEGVRARNEFARLLATKPSAGAGGPRGEETVGQGLREHVGEFGDRFFLFGFVGLNVELRQQGRGESGPPIMQLLGGGAIRIRLGDNVSDQVGKMREPDREVVRGGDPQRFLDQK